MDRRQFMGATALASVLPLVGGAASHAAATPALLLAMTLLLAGRILLGTWLAWSDASPDGAWELVSRGGLLAVGGVLLGHALATTWGLRHRLRTRPRGRPL